ncbi:multidrug resistance-associated ABC transporter [Trametes versicolor FP-101664 SS1]|uniref:multidrug resistance-associated ABC transporter n=1 Tax=Trametes versicolor (strain FP-101664) TaxID=717944 RepID=UPI0004623F34|nr:multidrug resistance-associated ABC transporter [Trametes versicolor FP-101664 SS1]EIW62518.1 multidrug resistance-associated ABC transporter [Trametes versicolor FP-101664 SS1]
MDILRLQHNPLSGEEHGSGVLVFKLARLLSCVALLCLSIPTVTTTSHGFSDTPAWWFQFVQVETYTYVTALALAAVLLPRYSALLSHHLSLILLLTWGVYVYRDAVPLATTTLRPADADEGVLIWIKLLILTEAAVLLPVFTPRVTVPRSPEGPNKEQKAGWYSRRMFSWLNETVAKAHRVEHIPLEDLPTLANSDRTRNLVEKSLKYLDPLETRKDTHIFWGFLKLYRVEYLLGASLVAVSSIALLAYPIATQGVLSYLEKGHAQSVVRPWAWVMLMFVGPTVSTICEEWYNWTMNRLSIRTEAIVTELLFQHALRIRMKSETSTDSEGTPSDGAAAADAPAQPKSDVLVGKLNNLITSDLANITEGNKQGLLLLIQSPLQMAAAIVFMYSILGWSALVGLATLVALIPIPGYLSSWIQTFQKRMMDKTDARVQLVNEVLNVVRMIKLFGWESRVSAQLDERREAELKQLSQSRWLEIFNALFNYSIPLITMAVTFSVYTAVMKQELTASKLFASNAAFILIQNQMHGIFFAIPALTQARVSLDRINGFLHQTELLDEFMNSDSPAEYNRPRDNEDVLGIKQTSFTWARDADVQTPASSSSGQQSRRFVLNVDGELLFKRGCTNLIVGPTGSGKTSLLMALLGEMHARPSGPESFVSLPRGGGVAYAAQESWVLSDTIRNNILFGAPLDEVRYAKVVKQCALERDLGLFDAGDQTEVGEKGITLSGGQKARLTLARAVYSSADILLLDDVLAALDVHTGRWIVDQCFKGDLVRGRTVLLVSHNVALIRPIADFVVALGSDGRIASQGSPDKTLQHDSKLLAELSTEEEQLKEVEQVLGKPELEAKDAQQNGKLVVAEEIKEGHVGWDTLRLFAVNSSKHPVLYWAAYMTMMAVTHSFMNSQFFYLGIWAAQYEHHAPSEVSVAYYLSIYGLLVFATIASYAVAWLFYISGSMHASRIIHSKLVTSILGTTLRWLDTTPTSRIIARCTADMQAVDTTLPRFVLATVETAIFMILRVIATALVAPLFIVPAVIIGALGALLGWIYMKAQICVKREMSNTRAPVLGHFGSAISGIVSIRAYGAQDQFKSESYLRVDRYSRAAFVYNGLNRWIAVRVDVMGTLLSVILAAYLVYSARVSASNAGFAMNMAVGFSATILQGVRMFNYLQVAGMHLERVQQYLVIEQEQKPTTNGVPPAYWPASGELRVEKLSARYSSDGSRVLHEISFEVKPGERIGIVGRTGSGKSSLTLALLRCILTEGNVYYDGITTDSINLDALRSNITIIPQTPELLSGTLRRNLDPFEEHDDATLNDALRSAGLFSLQEGEENARLTLDSEIAGGGSNLSVGQRQILALARAIVRRSKLLILDEATSAIDYATDAIIQNTLREELGRDVTVLTVAHRLQSVMDADRIMVLDAGRIVEYDAPRSLLQKEDGYFRSLVDGSGDKAALYAQAGYDAAS